MQRAVRGNEKLWAHSFRGGKGVRGFKGLASGEAGAKTTAEEHTAAYTFAPNEYLECKD